MESVKRFAFLMEQTLGNAVHATNLRNAYRDETGVKIEWLDINFPPEAGLDRLPPFRNNWTLRSGLKARRAISGLKSRPDLYFFHTATPSIFAVDKTRGVPTIISMDATPLNYDEVGAGYNHKSGNKLSETLKLSIHRRTFQAAKHLVTWSHWVKKSLVEDYGIPADRIEVIRPGTNLKLWERSPEETAARLTRDANRPVRILFVGGDFKRKGGLLLLDSYRQVFQSFDPALPLELHLVTKAEELADDPAKGIFIHRGVTANSPKLQQLFREADIFALPTEGDCLPVVLGEAMAAGLPLISTDVGAIKEAVLEGENGFLIKPGDEEALVKALRTLVQNPELRQQMGEKSRKLAEAEHDAVRNSQRLLELCKRVAG